MVVAAVPWARPGARFTRSFEDTCAWLTARTTATVVCELLRITWRSVSAVVDRVIADRAGSTDMLAGLKRIGIDEIAHRRGHRYLTCVVDHDTGRLVWAAPGRNSETLDTFFEALGTERCAQLTHVTADGAEWIHTVVTKRAPEAALCLDPFHIVAWATKALDEVRRQTWNQLRSSGNSSAAKTFKGSRWALMKNPQDLTGRQRTTLAGIAKTNARLYRAYLLKEQLRMVFAAKGQPGRVLLAGWIAWARRCRIPEFVKLARDHHQVPAADQEHAGPRNVERTLGGNEYASTNPDHPGVRIPHPRSADLHGHAHPRRTLPTPARTKSPMKTTGGPVFPARDTGYSYGSHGARSYLMVLRVAELSATGGIYRFHFPLVTAYKGRISIGEQDASSRQLGYSTRPLRG